MNRVVSNGVSDGDGKSIVECGNVYDGWTGPWHIYTLFRELNPELGNLGKFSSHFVFNVRTSQQ